MEPNNQTALFELMLLTLSRIEIILKEIKRTMTEEAPINAVARALTVTVAATTSTKVLDLNRIRRSAVIVNDGAVDCYLSLGAAASSGAGIRLNPQGGSFTFGRMTDFPYSGEVYAYSAAGTTLSIVEV